MSRREPTFGVPIEVSVSRARSKGEMWARDRGRTYVSDFELTRRTHIYHQPVNGRVILEVERQYRDLSGVDWTVERLFYVGNFLLSGQFLRTNGPYGSLDEARDWSNSVGNPICTGSRAAMLTAASDR